MERGSAAAMTFSRNGSSPLNSRATAAPSIASGALRIRSARVAGGSAPATREGALGWLPIQSSASGWPLALARPSSAAIAAFEPQA
jgi:hypothetical protein